MSEKGQSISNRKGKTAFIVNSVLIVLGMAMAISGLLIQYRYHLQSAPEETTVLTLCRAEWNAVHLWTSIGFLLAAIYHVWAHRKWYKTLFRRKQSSKQRPTCILTILTFIVVITGLIPLYIFYSEGNSTFRFSMIEIHDKVAILFLIVAFRHTIKRRKWYLNMIK